jgi:hypothetical protein
VQEGGKMQFGPEEFKMQGNIDWLDTYNLALEDKVVCDTEGCNNEAEFWTKFNCCNSVLIGCRLCVGNRVRVTTALIKQGKGIICPECSKVVNPLGWLKKPEKLSLL